MSLERLNGVVLNTEATYCISLPGYDCWKDRKIDAVRQNDYYVHHLL